MTRRRVRLQETTSNRGAGVFECACYLGKTEGQFVKLLPVLLDSGFPPPDLILDTYDMDAVDRWLDNRSGIVPTLSNLGNDNHRDRLRLWGKSG